jgi:segregation and condensation protein B
MATEKTIKSAFESMMFVWGEPLEAKVAAAAMNITKGEAAELFHQLQKEYDERESGIRIREINGSFQFITDESNFDYIRSIVTPARERKLSQAALETLAIVAYRQPVTKSEIDSIRGIKSERVLEGLAGKGLVEERGRSSAVGRPILYGTTDAFLAYLDLKDLKELPEIDDVEEAIRFEEMKPAIDDRQTSLDLDGLTKENTSDAED